ncbi:MAG: hypothetical protein IKX45_00160 [Bacteroidales bacterium]|nr:hypothetical protein [Bacteroidales bacterium]
MKKILITVIVALMALSANAQVAPGMKYKDLKKVYNSKEYVQQAIDPYRVGWTKFFTFFTPGIGQIMMGEVGRGFIFVGAEVICTSIVSDSWDGLKPYLVVDANGTVTGVSDKDAAKKHITGILVGLAGTLATSIWACIDAGKIAKVKNMYYQDMYGRQASVNVGLEPYFSLAPTAATPSGSSITPAAGMSLKLRF